jgi:hypothetical protein
LGTKYYFLRLMPLTRQMIKIIFIKLHYQRDTG